MPVTFENIVLTKEAAQNLLEKNHLNRPVKQRVVGVYADDMASGRWQFTAEAIKVDEHGNLLDGQHRCLALIQANADLPEGAPPVTVRVLLVRGLETGTQDAMDSGTRRSVADQLARRGSPAYSQIAAGARCALAFKMDDPRPPRAEIIRFYDANRDQLEAGAHVCAAHGNSSGLNPSALLAAWFLISEVASNEEDVAKFFHLLRTGVELPDGSPILALRSRANTAKMRREALANTVATGLIVRAWNAWRTDAPLAKIPIRTRGELVTVKRIES